MSDRLAYPPTWPDDERIRLAVHLEALRVLDEIPENERDAATLGSIAYHREAVRHLTTGREVRED